ncbi:MAG: hypothetical protein J4O03_16745, partial [Chloroflexi bacterium]|nr:hypothetical protein [Chloroflexota bacterium]
CGRNDIARFQIEMVLAEGILEDYQERHAHALSTGREKIRDFIVLEQAIGIRQGTEGPRLVG